LSDRVYDNLGDIILDCASIFEPPERLTVADAAEKYVVLHNPPAYIGPYKNDETPYMREPMDMAISRDHNGLIFVSSAQSAKTQGLILNTLAYTIKCNPIDVILYNPSQAAARDFSKRRVDRLHRHSPFLKAELLPGQNKDNTFDKNYKSGMMFTLSWPSIVEMAGKPVPWTMLTDYDRMPMDVDGEGAPFFLAQKRTTTFRSFAMTIAESSPSKDILDPRWKPSKERPHEAPPCEGILALYNMGDRRRWYWPCPHCGEFFEGTFELLKWETMSDPALSAKTVYMVCPKNGCYIKQESRYDMNLRGVWLCEGEKIDKHGVRSGTPLVSATASYWLKGVAAAFTTWSTLVLKYINAEIDYQKTGSQDSLKVTVNTDQGEPYLPRGQETNRLAEDIQSHAIAIPERTVPEDVRCLFATCDVQKNRWEVQVHGIRPGNPYDIVVVDRFAIIKSNRLDDDNERLWVKPSAHPEDWDLLITEVMDRKYPLAGGNGEMGIAYTVCDSGGKEGVTTNAYLFYSKLRKIGRADRFMLLKGDPSPNAPRVRKSFPDSERKDRLAKARGEVPVLMINSNSVKDTLNGMLPANEETPARKVEGEYIPAGVSIGRIIFPDWLDTAFFEELTVETRTSKGWENKHSRRNESWDLLAYCIALCIHRRVEHVSWLSPPTWLAPWENNPFVKMTGKKAVVAQKSTSQYGLAQLGEALG
jgi:phage terminase large subunit GpA-like protein